MRRIIRPDTIFIVYVPEAIIRMYFSQRGMMSKVERETNAVITEIPIFKVVSMIICGRRIHWSCILFVIHKFLHEETFTVIKGIIIYTNTYPILMYMGKSWNFVTITS